MPIKIPTRSIAREPESVAGRSSGALGRIGSARIKRNTSELRGLAGNIGTLAAKAKKYHFEMLGGEAKRAALAAKDRVLEGSPTQPGALFKKMSGDEQARLAAVMKRQEETANSDLAKRKALNIGQEILRQSVDGDTGSKAVENLPLRYKEFSEMYGKAIDDMKLNASERDFVNRQTASIVRDFQRQADSHARKEQEKYDLDNHNGYLASVSQNAGTDYMRGVIDPVGDGKPEFKADASLRELNSSIAEHDEARGVSENATKARQIEWSTKLVTGVVHKASEEGNAGWAIKFLERNKHLIDPTAYNRLKQNASNDIEQEMAYAEYDKYKNLPFSEAIKMGEKMDAGVRKRYEARLRQHRDDIERTKTINRRESAIQSMDGVLDIQSKLDAATSYADREALTAQLNSFVSGQCRKVSADWCNTLGRLARNEVKQLTEEQQNKNKNNIEGILINEGPSGVDVETIHGMLDRGEISIKQGNELLKKIGNPDQGSYGENSKYLKTIAPSLDEKIRKDPQTTGSLLEYIELHRRTNKGQFPNARQIQDFAKALQEEVDTSWLPFGDTELKDLSAEEIRGLRHDNLPPTILSMARRSLNAQGHQNPSARAETLMAKHLLMEILRKYGGAGQGKQQLQLILNAIERGQ